MGYKFKEVIIITSTEMLIGKRERMNWIVETSYGSGGTLTSGEVVGLNCTIDPDFNQNWQEVLTAGADTRNIQDRVPGPLTLPYTMTFVPFNWRFLKYVLTCANGDDGGVKTHTFTVGNTIQSWKLEWARRHTTNHVLTLVGNFCKSLTINFQKSTGEGAEGFLSVAMNCVAQDVSESSTVASISNVSTDPFQWRHTKVTIGGTEVPEINNGEITIDNGIDESDSRYCSTTYSNTLADPIPKTFRITGRFNVNIKDSTVFDDWAAAIVVSGTNSLLFDRDGTGNDQILFTFSNFRIHQGVPPTNLEGVTNVDIVWSAEGSTIVARDSTTTY